MAYRFVRWSFSFVAVLGLVALDACVAKTSHIVAPATDAQVRGVAPQLGGNWLVTETGKPRMIWALKQTVMAIDGTITIDARDAVATAAATPQPLHGTLIGVGEAWQVQMSEPVGYMTLQDLNFRYCPLTGGKGGCRSGQQIFGPLPTAGVLK
jgi:hypothetical protein